MKDFFKRLINNPLSDILKKRQFKKKLDRCIVDALLDSYRYPADIIIVRSDNDFIHLRKGVVKRAKKNNNKLLRGRSLKHIMDTAIVTVRQGAIVDWDIRLSIDSVKLVKKAQQLQSKNG